MRKLFSHRIFFLLGGLLILPSIGLSQKEKSTSVPAKVTPVIFAVLNDGKTLEPIAYFSKNKLEKTVTGIDEPKAVAAFNRAYYKKGTAYRLVFGGAEAGTASIKSSDPNSDCSKNMASVVTKASRAQLSGLVMGLATNIPIKTSKSYRRRPTADEKDQADALANQAFAKQKLTPNELRYQNLTALDLDNDGSAELVGSYWVEIDRLTRGLYFFIAERGSNGKFSAGFEEYRMVDQGGVMSSDIKDVDSGIYHELLLDVFDYDNDGVSEVFTYLQSFEGASFNVYRRNGAKWAQIFSTSNYHCAY